jgi:hypothetical protein
LVYQELVNALKFTEDFKVCLNDDLVKHKFFYVEEWIQTDLNENRLNEIRPIGGSQKEKEFKNKYLKRCYFGKFVSTFIFA